MTQTGNNGHGKIKAIVFTAAQQAELVEIDGDTTPLGDNEVAGRTLASLISPGTELNWGYMGAKFPAYPGYASVFEVEAIGGAVTDLKPGDRVFCTGPHRSRQRVAREVALKVPDGLAPEVAVFARLMGVSMSTLTTTTARPPERVLVTGLGPVGLLAAQIFSHCGYEVIACDPLQGRRELAMLVGLSDVRAAVPIDDKTLVGKIALHVECSGHEQAVLGGCQLVRKRGEVVLVGVPWKRRTELSAFDILHAVFHKYLVLRSGWEWEVPRQPTDFVTGSIQANLAAALRWLAEGKVSTGDCFALAPPAEAQRVYQDLLHLRGDKIVTVFDWTSKAASVSANG